MMTIQVKNRIVSSENRVILISDNTDYHVKFECDEEWIGKTKTARFVGKNMYKDMILDSNNECEIPVELLKTGTLKIGLFSAEYSTSDLTVNVIPSIRSIMAKPLDYISEDLYRQILERIDGIQAGEVSEEVIALAVQKYLEENPVSSGGGTAKVDTATETLTITSNTATVDVESETLIM